MDHRHVSQVFLKKKYRFFFCNLVSRGCVNSGRNKQTKYCENDHS